MCQRENDVMPTNSLRNDPRIINTSYLIDLIQTCIEKNQVLTNFSGVGPEVQQRNEVEVR